MKIRMKVAMSGTRDGLPWPARGTEADLPDQEAADLCASGMAEPIAKIIEPETRPSAASVEKRKPTK